MSESCEHGQSETGTLSTGVHRVAGLDETPPATEVADRTAFVFWLSASTLAMCAAAPALLVSLVIPALPDLQAHLDVSSEGTSWILTATLLSSTITLPIFSRMADMYGRRRLLLVSLGCLVLGSVLAAFSGSFVWVLVGRALQGLSAAVIPISFGVAQELFPRERVNSAVAMISGAMGVGLALGLPLGGVIRTTWGLAALFWLPGAVGLALTAAVLALVPPDRRRSRTGFDVLGATVLGLSLTALLTTISYGATWGWTSQRVILLALVALVGTVAWVPLQLRAPFPTIDIRLSLARPVVFTNLASAFVAVPVMSNMIVTALQVTAPTTTGYGFGLTSLEAGSIMLPFGLVMVVLSPIAGVLLNRWGARHVLMLGCMVVAIVFSARVFADHSVLNVIISTSVIGAGLSLAFAAIPALTMDAVPSADSASANGVNNLVRALASCIATAAIALLVSTTSVNVAGQEYLSQGGLHLGFWLSALAAAIAAGFAALVPGARLRNGQIGVTT